ncbi:MAG: molybdopterin-dependent oxidoreductase [Rhodocyclaceae bacterium]
MSNPLNPTVSRRRFLQATGAAGAATAVGVGTGALPGFTAIEKVHAQPAAEKSGETVITKSFCHQCPARCGIDVYTTNGRVHSIFGTLDNPLSNGKLCPKGHLGTFLLYDPDRFKGPMKRTNPKKGRNEDPGFVPISWDEALQTVADRLNTLRDKGESHRFGLLFGRGWGAVDAGLLGTFGKLYGTPNSGLGHSSTCADGSKKAKLYTDGNYDYSSYDYAHCNNLLIFGAGFLEAFRPYNYNMQVWGQMRTKAAKTKVTVVDVHMSTTGAAADRLIMIKPGTDGAMALAMAHVILTEGLWDRKFVGDFKPVVQPKDPAAARLPSPTFETGKEIDPALFEGKWTHGLIEWWNAELKDRTPEWAEKITTVPAREIIATARELATVKPSIALFERGPTAHTNGVYNGMAIHSLNALTGSLWVEGGMLNQTTKTPWAKLSLKYEDYMDDYAKSDDRKKPKIDGVGTKYKMASAQIQRIGEYHLKGDPYKMDTLMFYLTAPIFSSPENNGWEKALQDIFVIDTTPYPSENAMFSDLILPDNTYLERLQIADTYSFQGYPMSMIRTPAVKPVHDTKTFGDTLIEIGKRIKGPTSEYYKQLGNTENIIKQMVAGFAENPGDNGVNDYESFKAKGVWFNKTVPYRQKDGVFYAWDKESKSHSIPIDAAKVKEKIFKTPTGKFEFKSGYMEQEKYAHYIHDKHGIAEDRVGFPQWIAPKYSGTGDLHFIASKLPIAAEGRAGNLAHAIAVAQPTQGGKRDVFVEINPETAAKKGIKDGDVVLIKSKTGSVKAPARIYAGVRPDTVFLPYFHGHWAQGRWAKAEERIQKNSVNEVIENVSDPISGLACYYSGMCSIEKA